MLKKYVRKTPNFKTSSHQHKNLILKLETLQIGGSFKIRGALSNVLNKFENVKVGLCAVSAGNHAIATAYAGKIMNIPTVVVMPRPSTNIERVNRCQNLGATVILVDSKNEAFEKVRKLAGDTKGIWTIYLRTLALTRSLGDPFSMAKAQEAFNMYPTDENIFQLRNYLENREDRSWGLLINFVSKFTQNTTPKVQVSLLVKGNAEQTIRCVDASGKEIYVNKY